MEFPGDDDLPGGWNWRAGGPFRVQRETWEVQWVGEVREVRSRVEVPALTHSRVGMPGASSSSLKGPRRRRAKAAPGMESSSSAVAVERASKDDGHFLVKGGAWQISIPPPLRGDSRVCWSRRRPKTCRNPHRKPGLIDDHDDDDDDDDAHDVGVMKKKSLILIDGFRYQDG